jgi:transposase
MERMTRKQWKRLEVLERLDDGDWTMSEAAELAGVSTRHLRRLRARYAECGHQCLLHGNAGRAPENRVVDKVREQILELRRGKYDGFNDTHFTEKIVELEKVRVSRQTVQRLLRRAGIASPRKRRPRKYRRRRERMPQPGMMILWDGSEHDWLEGRGPKLCLMGAVDDATGKLLAGAHFVEHECAAGYFRVLRGIVHQHGVPWKAYMDSHSSLRRNDDSWTLEEELAGRQEPTQVGRALEALSVEVIFADSPQAKGRIERAWGTLQDRLTSELRLAGASTAEDANVVLEGYRSEYNKRFGVAPASCRPAWRKLPRGVDLDRICSFYTTAKVRNDNTVPFEGRMIDLPAGPHDTSLAGKVVEIRQLLNGEIRVYLGDEMLVSVSATPRRYSLRRRNRSLKEKPPRAECKAQLTFKEIKRKYREAG